MATTPIPQSRGLEETEPKAVAAVAAVAVAAQPTKITKVISYGNGVLTVEMDDGNHYKREGGTLAWRGQNPGNIRYGDFAKSQGAVGSGYDGMSVFPTIDVGKSAMKELLFGNNSRYLDLSIKRAMSIYAPDYDGNDSSAYAAFVCKAARLSNIKALRQLTGEERDRMLAAMQRMEGNKVGTVTKVTK